MCREDILSMIGVFILVLGLIFAVVYGLREEAEARRVFMTRCLEDHKDYECEAMSRAMESHVIIVQ